LSKLETPLNECCILDEDAPEAMAAAYRKDRTKESFEFDVHGNNKEDNPTEMTVSQIEKARTGQKKCWKRHLLCHTGEMI